MSRASAVALAAPRVDTRNTHGTGCSLSAAIAAGLAKGEDMETAARNAKRFISEAIGSVAATLRANFTPATVVRRSVSVDR